MFPSQNISLLDLDWFLINISKIEGNNLAISMSAKSKFSNDVITRTFANVNMLDSSTSGTPSMFLAKVPNVGETFYTNFAGTPFPLYVNRTLDKYIGTHLVNGFEMGGTRTSYHETDGTAMETSINLFYGKQSGLPLQINLNSELGSPIYGTITLNVKIMAIDFYL